MKRCRDEEVEVSEEEEGDCDSALMPRRSSPAAADWGRCPAMTDPRRQRRAFEYMVYQIDIYHDMITSSYGHTMLSASPLEYNRLNGPSSITSMYHILSPPTSDGILSYQSHGF